MDKVTRRSFVTTVGAATVVPAAALLSATGQAAAAPPKAPKVGESTDTPYLFFNSAEAQPKTPIFNPWNPARMIWTECRQPCSSRC